MRVVFALLSFIVIAGCSSSDSPSAGPPPPAGCTVDEQKQFVLDATLDWYLWNDNLPANVNINSYATPSDLLAFLTTFSPDDGSGRPIDRFSFIGSAEADQQFFGAGRFEGYGFSSRFVATNDLRLSRVFVDSPANRGGLARGQRVLELNGRTIADIQAAEGVNAVLQTSPVTFRMRETDGSEFETTLEREIVTIDPIPQFRIIDNGGTPVGYMELATFVTTADTEFDPVFALFRSQNVSDVIIDMRYNGGGVVSTAELLGDYLGGFVAENLVFSRTEFNADRAPANNTTELFERQGNSINLVRFIVIASGSTASASELVINGLGPHAEVVIVGDDTFGKPVGQVGFTFCDNILRLTAFQTANANGFADYFDGLPVDCPAADDLNVAVGDLADPNITAALEYLSTGACPVLSVPGSQFKPTLEENVEQFDLSGPPWREFAGAF